MQSVSAGEGSGGAGAPTGTAAPDSLTLGPRPGGPPSTAPPVEIYIGTEPAQFRALRVLLWSIRRTRDPARTYRVHVMSGLAGFDRRGWTTGFTNYRFAVPHFAMARAAGQGEPVRAIYCDAGQVFLADPGLLFDLPLNDGAGRPYGFRAISDMETSVMLIDCARMARIWTSRRRSVGGRRRFSGRRSAGARAGRSTRAGTHATRSTCRACRGS